MEDRQYRSRQGRSDKQYQDSIKMIGYGALLLLGGLGAMAIYDFILWLS